MTTQMGYMDFRQEEVVANSGTKVRMASPGQIKFYNDLCKQRNMIPEDVSTKTYDSLSLVIKELTSFYPATQPQIDLVVAKVESLKDSLSKVNFNDEQIAMFERDVENQAHVIVSGILRGTLELESILSKLTGGKSGTASDLIGRLIKAEGYFEELHPATQAQIDTLVGMFLCPDVELESHDIPRRITIDVEEGTWRKPTPKEFAEYISLTFNNKSASDFINNCSNAFHEWKKTRIRPEQLRYIMTLEAQLANDSKLRELRQGVDQAGNVTEVGQSANVQMKGTAYVQHTDEQLIHFTIEQASQFIAQLKSEVSRREAFSLEDNLDEVSRGTKTIEDALKNEFEVLDNMMYKLEAIAGYADEELHHCASYDVSSDTTSNEYKTTYIRDFIKQLIENKAITFYGIMELAEESIALQRILLNM